MDGHREEREAPTFSLTPLLSGEALITCAISGEIGRFLHHFHRTRGLSQEFFDDAAEQHSSQSFAAVATDYYQGSLPVFGGIDNSFSLRFWNLDCSPLTVTTINGGTVMYILSLELLSFNSNMGTFGSSPTIFKLFVLNFLGMPCWRSRDFGSWKTIESLNFSVAIECAGFVIVSQSVTSYRSKSP